MELAEFREQAQRMCNSDYCGECPYESTSECETINGMLWGSFRPVEKTVAKWSKAHPESVYPSYGKWFSDTFPGGSPGMIMPCVFTGKAECAENNFDCDACRSHPMHPAVAEKLGVKPIGWGGCKLTADQAVKADAGKPRVSLVPTQIIWDIAEVREYGNRKYGDSEGWRTVGMQRYIDALLRHTLAFWEDPEGVDAESGLPHYKHMACNMAFICWMMRETPQ